MSIHPGRIPRARRATGLLRTALLAGLLMPLSQVAGNTAATAAPADRFAAFKAGSSTAVDHSAWDKLLKTYVVAGADGINRVDYARFKSEGHAALKRYVAALEKTDVSGLDRPEQFAFWANLYNAKTVDVVLDKYPVKSIKDISLGGGLLTLVTGGPWKAKIMKVGGEPLSLDDIEHEILRPLFKDPRVHYAVNCASLGCPNLGTMAFTGAGLGDQLDAAARAFANHRRGIEVIDGKVKASSIYNWFQKDFGGTDQGVLEHVRSFATAELKAGLAGINSISSYDYDWSINDIARSRTTGN